MHEAGHAARVREFIRTRIEAADGWLPFDLFMDLALYAPGLGYYSAGARKMGAGGDFTTAPEISPLFGRCLARHCAQVLRAVQDGEILELGAGTGRLAFDILSAMASQNVLPARYRILEISADLRERQRALLATLPAQLASRVEWIESPPAEPWQGALIANEVLDALPVECFTWQDGRVHERGVTVDDQGRFFWQQRPASASLLAEVNRVRGDARAEWPSGYASELCSRVGPWLAEVTRALSRGVALFIDYGLARHEYYHPGRASGTLQCHYHHRSHDDPFAHPGMEDITAWVDFTRVAEAADAAGLEVMGYTTQAALLLGLGIEGDVAVATDELTRVRRAAETRRLLMPEEMGETFKAIVLGRDLPLTLAGFSLQDLRQRL